MIRHGCGTARGPKTCPAAEGEACGAGSVVDVGERCAEMLGFGGEAVEVLVRDAAEQLAEVDVDTNRVPPLQRRRDAVADPLERRHVSAETVEVAGGRVDEKLTRPEVEACTVDLGRLAVLQLEIESRLPKVDCGLSRLHAV